MERIVNPPDYWLTADLARESEKLLHEAKTGYRHHGGRGELREENFMQFLERRLPQSIAATKGHIGDSDWNLTSEFDIILYDPFAKMILAEAGKGRCVLPVESVRAVIEVRTNLDSAALRDASNKMEELSGLRRYYKQTAMADLLLGKLESSECSCAATGSDDLLLPVLCYVVGYDGISLKSLNSEMKKAHENIEGSLILGKTLLTRGMMDTPEGLEDFERPGFEHMCLSFWLVSLLGHLMNFANLSAFSRPDLERYTNIPDHVQLDDS